jgi:hypothetical protein
MKTIQPYILGTWVGVILAVFVLAAYGEESSPRKQTKYGMDCSGNLNGAHSIYRCENEEVVCYNHDEHLSCNWKQNK